MAEDAPKTEAEAPKRRFKIPRTAVLVTAVAVGEALLIFLGLQLLGGGPQASYGSGGESVVTGPDPMTQTTSVEIQLLEKFRVPNSRQGATWIFDIDLVVKVPAHRRDQIDKLKTERSGEISDAIASIIRSLDPRYLNEPDLQTLRVQVHRVLGQIVGDPNLIEAVLIPRCVPIKAG